MREVLEPIFGAWGAVVVQFVLTAAVLLALIGIAVWFVRRYSGVSLGGIGRGRVPRLAIVDAMPVDSRRKLVLVRRDNVEHLLLIGGSGDIVVESAIQRVRQRTAQQAAQLAAARAAMQPEPEPAGTAPGAETEAGPPGNEPIPFPAPRQPPALRANAGNNGRPPLRTVQRPLPPPPEPVAAPAPQAALVEPQRPSRVQPMPDEPPMAAPPSLPEDGAEPFLPEMAPAEPTEPASPPPAPAYADADADETRQAALNLGEAEAPVPGDHAPPSEETAVKVSDLEREMARLLDEISTRRSS